MPERADLARVEQVVVQPQRDEPTQVWQPRRQLLQLILRHIKDLSGASGLLV